MLVKKNLIKREGINISSLNKIFFKKILKAVSHLLFLLYLVFSLIPVSGCKENDAKLSFEHQLEKRSHTIKLLEAKYGAKLLSCDAEEAIDKIVILDTLVIGIKNKGDDFILRAKINNNCGKEYFAELKCRHEIAEHFKTTKSNCCILAARISNVYYCEIVAEADSLNGENHQLNLGSSVLITGQCLALAEIPAILNAN